jgi:3D-(3,5/4)-trihydroxycyclohexane-1,2-dione acylhydrolase (decyclizing)
MVGDGNYLMNNHEIITAVQEGVKFTIVLLNNNGFGSIGALSESVGSKRFGTKYKFRNNETGQIDGDILPVDFVKNAESLGAKVIKADSIESLNDALKKAKESDKVTVIYIETDLEKSVEGYCWWDVAVAEVSEIDTVQEAHKDYLDKKKNQKYYL